MKTINQYKVVQNQYKTADNLNTRISIHKKYSTNKLGFNNWIFSHYNISPNIRILELGCGTGDIWKSNLHLLDKRNIRKRNDKWRFKYTKGIWNVYL